MITSSIVAASIPARRTDSLIVNAPSCGDGNEERPPRYLPIGVRQAERMTGVVESDTDRARALRNGYEYRGSAGEPERGKINPRREISSPPAPDGDGSGPAPSTRRW